MKALFVIILTAFIVRSEDLPIGSICQAHDGSQGTCVVVKSCESIVVKLQNRSIPMNQIKICNNSRRYICCPAEDLEDDTISSRLGIDENDEMKSFWNITENPFACGEQKIAVGNIYYGTQIHHGAYPWNAALTKSDDGSFFCSGSLISKNFVITAAHCIEGKYKTHYFKPRDILVTLGGHNLKALQEPNRITMAVKTIYVHHDWNPYIAAYDADIAMIKLERGVSFNDYIQPICLAALKSEASKKTEGFVVGFGKSEFQDVENIARVIKLPIHSYKFCANSPVHQSFVTHRTFCAGYANGTSVCRGDSGGALMVINNGIHYLRGIVSSSIFNLLHGCEIYAYAVFTDILEYHSWITTGQDDKLLLRDVLNENRKIKTEMINLTKSLEEKDLLINQLREEIKLLKFNITSSNRIDLEKGADCRTDDGVSGVCIDFNNCESIDVHVFPTDEVTYCNKEMNYICCADTTST